MIQSDGGDNSSLRRSDHIGGIQPAAEAYDYFCDEVENCLPYIFGAGSTIRDLDPDAADEKRLLRGTIVAAVNKMYLDCCFVAMRQEEALWPGILGDLQ